MPRDTARARTLLKRGPRRGSDALDGRLRHAPLLPGPASCMAWIPVSGRHTTMAAWRRAHAAHVDADHDAQHKVPLMLPHEHSLPDLGGRLLGFSWKAPSTASAGAGRRAGSARRRGQNLWRATDAAGASGRRTSEAQLGDELWVGQAATSILLLRDSAVRVKIEQLPQVVDEAVFLQTAGGPGRLPSASVRNGGERSALDCAPSAAVVSYLGWHELE